MNASPYEAIAIDEKSWRIEENRVRCFLFKGTEKALLVDTGFGSGDLKAFVEKLTDLPIMLVNSHADIDHIGCNNSFGAAYLHPAEFSTYRTRKLDDTDLRPLWEGDRIDLGGRVFEVVLISGHTPGSIALLDHENRILISGDTVQTTPVFIFGPNRSVPGIIATLKKLETMFDLYDTVYSSHGAFPIGKEAVSAQREAAERLLAGKLEPMDPPMEIPAKMYVYGAASFFL